MNIDDSVSLEDCKLVTRKRKLGGYLILSLLGAPFALLSQPVFSEDVHLEPLKPSLDSVAAGKQNLLNGQVSQEAYLKENVPGLDISHGRVIINIEKLQTNGPMTIDQARDLMKTMRPGNVQSQIFFGRRSGVKMSADEFRKLEYGVIGMVSHVTEAQPVVTQVYPTCPAYLSGIRPGDVVVKGNDHVFRRGEGQREMWQVVGGKAGTPVDVTVLREGELLTFHMKRMNIEDIENDRIRRMYEFILSALGPPAGTGSDFEPELEMDSTSD